MQYTDTDHWLQDNTGFHAFTALRFVESNDRYSTYEDRDGEEVWLAHGTARRLVEFEDLDVQTLWRHFPTANQHSFRDSLRALVIDPDEVDDQVTFCSDCSDPEHPDDMYGTHNGLSVCQSCYDDYYFCNCCEESYRDTRSVGDSEVCEGCLDRHYSYCDECERYYNPDAYDEDHDHESGCGCESPAMHFTIRNDGEAPLANDTRVTIQLPAGVISDEGIAEIGQVLRNERPYRAFDDPFDEEYETYWNLSNRLDNLGPEWQTRKGNFTKRLSRFAYQEFGLKLTPEVVSRVGCIARDHSTAVDFAIETTRNLNLSAEEFCHEESCWWSTNTEYGQSRCALKSNGGFGLRTFTARVWGSEPTGRAWVMPLKRSNENSVNLEPTFETREPDAFVVFNGYGDLSGYTPARILSHMAGMTYRKIDFTCEPMYVNSEVGYLVAPEEIASHYTDGGLSLRTDAHSNLFHSERTLAHA